QIPKLRDYVLAPAVTRFARDEGETPTFIDMPCRCENAVRPECDLLVTGSVREADALVNEPRAQAQPTGLRINKQQAKASDATLVALHQHDAADILAVQLSNPASFELWIEVIDEIGNDLRAKTFERFAPAVFL